VSFTFTPCEISGLFEIRPKIFGDHRGYFFECYSHREFTANGIDAVFVQDNQSLSSKGTLRGLHFQKIHPQGKLVRVIEGEVFDVAVDIRKGSPTFGKYVEQILSEENKKWMWIPPGFAHGFCVLSEFVVFYYKCTDYYSPENDRSIKFNDPKININWHVDLSKAVISEKDAKAPSLELADNNFLY